MNESRVYLGLGGDEGPVLLRLRQALALLSLEPSITRLRVSSFYRTSPVEMHDALPFSWFTNAVCTFLTSLTPLEVFTLTQRIEKELGKVSKPKTASRPIDIDFLFYGDQVWRQSDLEIPHPRWRERLFVLVPLQELTKEIVIAGKEGEERYILEECIRSLLVNSSQEIFLI